MLSTVTISEFAKPIITVVVGSLLVLIHVLVKPDNHRGHIPAHYHLMYFLEIAQQYASILVRERGPYMSK